MGDRERVLEAVKSELEMANQNIALLKVAHSSALKWAKSQETENRTLKRKLHQVYDKYDALTGRGGDHKGKDPEKEVMGTELGMTVYLGDADIW